MLTHVAWVEDSRIFPSDFRERISFVAQQSVHVSNKPEILLIPAGITYSEAPFFNFFKNLGLHSGRSDRGSLWESPDELIEKLFGADLEVEGVPAVLNANIEEVEGKKSDVGVAMINVADDGSGGLAGSSALLVVDKVSDLEAQGKVGLVVLGAAGGLDEPQQLGGWPAEFSPAIAGRCPSRRCFHNAVLCRRRRSERAGDWTVCDVVGGMVCGVE